MYRSQTCDAPTDPLCQGIPKPIGHFCERPALYPHTRYIRPSMTSWTLGLQGHPFTHRTSHALTFLQPQATNVQKYHCNHSPWMCKANSTTEVPDMCRNFYTPRPLLHEAVWPPRHPGYTRSFPLDKYRHHLLEPIPDHKNDG